MNNRLLSNSQTQDRLNWYIQHFRKANFTKIRKIWIQIVLFKRIPKKDLGSTLYNGTNFLYWKYLPITLLGYMPFSQTHLIVTPWMAQIIVLCCHFKLISLQLLEEILVTSPWMHDPALFIIKCNPMLLLQSLRSSNFFFVLIILPKFCHQQISLPHSYYFCQDH